MQHDFIILDRSGSMQGTIWTESLNSINTYAKKLADENVDTAITLGVFDSNEPFRIIRDRIIPKTWRNVVSGERLDVNNLLEPRGGTPLNDATAHLIDLAEKGPPWGGVYEKAAIIIVTDGAENASQEYSIGSGGTEKIKARLDACRKRGWQVQFLGANFDNQAQAMSYGATRGSTISTTAANFGSTMEGMASKRSAYGLTGQAMSWTDEEKEKAKTDSKAS